MSTHRTPDRRIEPIARIERRWVREQLRARLFGAVPEPVRVARFILQRRLGAGANGVVYAAYDPKLEREVAVKVLAVDASEDALRLSEARILARLAHPNVLPVFEAGVDDGAAYLVSELVDGGTLREWLATPREPRELVRVLLEIGRGIGAGHQRALVHRDIKPENVLVGSDGRARVADFGLAAVYFPSVLEAVTESPTSLPGTMLYMAPEQLSGQRADPLSDQFSFCVLAYEALTGQLPFSGASGPELLESIRKGSFAPLARPAVDARAVAVLERGLRASSGARYPTMDALLGELEPRQRRIPPRRLVVLAASLAAGTALAVGLAARSDAPVTRATGREQATPLGSIDPSGDARAEQETSLAAQRLTQAGRWDECARYLATRADTEGLMLLWLGCARVASDPVELERACAAWLARPSGGDRASSSPLWQECSPALLRARQLARDGEFRACAETVLAAPPSPIGNIQLARCMATVTDRELRHQQCIYNFRSTSGDPKEANVCETIR